MINYVKISFISCILFTLFLGINEKAFGYFSQHTQEMQEDESKSVELLFKKRPATAIPNKPGETNIRPNRPSQTGSNPRAKRRYKTIRKSSSQPIGNYPIKKTEEAVIGFTIWKQAIAANSDGTKGVTEEQNNPAENTKINYQRLSSESTLAVGDVFKLSIESLSHSGFLYIIHRELYKDGTYSIPKVIHPIRGRNNYVSPGMVTSTGKIRITLPESEKQQIAEVFTIIIAPKALVSPIQLQGGFLPLNAGEFSKWKDKWEIDAGIIEQEDGTGQIMTKEEAEAIATSDEGKGIEEVRKLTQDDASPQTIYQAKIKQGDPIFTSLQVKFKP